MNHLNILVFIWDGKISKQFILIKSQRYLPQYFRNSTQILVLNLVDIEDDKY